MAQFYINSESDAQRCVHSRNARMPLTITGLTPDGNIKAFVGTVQSIENGQTRFPGYLWRITIREAPSGPPEAA